VLEEEITALLGRAKSQRRDAVDAPAGYHDGYGKPRRLSMQIGTITVQRPRVRGVEERFESRVLPLFERRTKEVGEILPELYLHGLANGDFELALRGQGGDARGATFPAARRARAACGRLRWEDVR
jgi:putative transposase